MTDREKLEKALKCLEYYANSDNWRKVYHGYLAEFAMEIAIDDTSKVYYKYDDEQFGRERSIVGGKRARQVLKELYEQDNN